MSSNSFQQDDYFKIDPELHLVGDMQPYIHFPGVQMWWKAIENIRRPLLGGATEELFAQLHPEDLAQLQPGNFTPTTDPEGVLGMMDRYGMDVGYQPNLSPIKHQGVRNAIWELEHWANEKGARIFKFYPPRTHM